MNRKPGVVTTSITVSHEGREYTIKAWDTVIIKDNSGFVVELPKPVAIALSNYILQVCSEKES